MGSNPIYRANLKYPNWGILDFIGDLNWKGSGNDSFPRRKVWENRGFPSVLIPSTAPNKNPLLSGSVVSNMPNRENGPFIELISYAGKYDCFFRFMR